MLAEAASLHLASAGPPLQVVFANLGRFAWPMLVGVSLGALAFGFPAWSASMVLALFANVFDIAEFVSGGAVVGISILGGAGGAFLVIAGAAGIGRADESAALRQVAKRCKTVSVQSLRRSGVNTFLYPVLAFVPTFYTYLIFAVLLTQPAVQSFDQESIIGLPRPVALLLTALLILVAYLVAAFRVRAVRRQMMPIRVLLAVLRRIGSEGHPAKPYGFYAPIPDPIGRYRYSLAKLAKIIDSSADRLAPELARLSTPHPLSAVLRNVSNGIRGFLADSDGHESGGIDDLRRTLDSVVCCLAEPQRPDLLKAAAEKVKEFGTTVGVDWVQDRPGSREPFGRRLALAIELIEGPGKVISSAFLLFGIGAAALAAIRGDFSRLLEILK